MMYDCSQKENKLPSVLKVYLANLFLFWCITQNIVMYAYITKFRAVCMNVMYVHSTCVHHFGTHLSGFNICIADCEGTCLQMSRREHLKAFHWVYCVLFSRFFYFFFAYLFCFKLLLLLLLSPPKHHDVNCLYTF